MYLIVIAKVQSFLSQMNDFFIFLVWLYQILEVTIKNDQEQYTICDLWGV